MVGDMWVWMMCVREKKCEKKGKERGGEVMGERLELFSSPLVKTYFSITFEDEIL